MILLDGDVHTNPGPPMNHSTSSNTSSSDVYNLPNIHNHLSVLHYNVQSLSPKLDILIAELSQFDILSFSETWLSDSHLSGDLLIPSFHSPERKDRDNHGGGVIVYVKNTLHYKRRLDLEVRGLECIWIELTLLRNRRVLLGVFYRPPNSVIRYNSLIEDSIGLANDTGVEDIIIMGDFNLNAFFPPAVRKIDSLCHQFGFTQCITDPTNFTESSSSIIDLLFIKNSDSLISSGVGDPCLSQNIRYHCPIFGVFRFTKPPCSRIIRNIWMYDAADFNNFRRRLTELDWSSIQDNNVDSYVKKFTAVLTDLMKEFIPNKRVRVNSSDSPWINSIIKLKIRQRKRLYRMAKRSGSTTDWDNFRRARNEVVNLVKKTKYDYYNNIALKLKSSNISPKAWWGILKSFISPNSRKSLPPLKSPVSDEVVYDTYEKANLLNNHFCHQSCIDDSNHQLPYLDTSTNNTLESIVITRQEVHDALNLLKREKASGPDGISNRVLIEIADQIAPHLAHLFNLSLTSCRMPTSWKIANVTPVFKKGDPSILNNYRPISLLNALEKVFERIIFKHIFNFLVDTNFFTPHQSGFMPNDSTVNQLVYIYNKFCQALDDGLEIRVIFFYISKAFDKVWHRGLLLKLQKAGLHGNLLSWFSNYLSERQQRVVLPGAQSELGAITAGVPQGSILGPLLFLVYINDIVTDISNNINLFADDTSLFVVVNNDDDSLSLQADIDKISSWASAWLVNFNPLKSETLTISRKRNQLPMPDFTMSNVSIPKVDFHKHLGVCISNSGNWHDHIEYISKKAWERINIMRRLKFTLDRKSLEVIYFSFVRPLLEYADAVWDNCLTADKQTLDKVQYEAARIVSGCTKLVSINSLLLEVGWDSLANRRRKHKLILFFKMVNGLSPPYLNSLVPDIVGNQSRYSLRNSDNLSNIATRTLLYQNSFLPSVIKEWNQLPIEVRTSPSVSVFKSRLDHDKPKSNPLFSYGVRRYQILHTRIRNNCSALKQHLFSKNVVDSPFCSCGHIESSTHYFLECTLYNNLRVNLLDSVSQYTTPSINILLRGDESLSLDNNKSIFGFVHHYIRLSGRFE